MVITKYHHVEIRRDTGGHMADSNKMIPPKVISKQTLMGAQEALKALPKTPDRDTYNGMEAIRALFDDILRLRLNGYTYSEIRKVLEKSGIIISKNTLQRYFKKFEHINLGIKSISKKKKTDINKNNNTDNNGIDEIILNNTEETEEETEEQINEDEEKKRVEEQKKQEDEKKRKEEEEKKRKGKKQKLEEITDNNDPFGENGI